MSVADLTIFGVQVWLGIGALIALAFLIYTAVGLVIGVLIK